MRSWRRFAQAIAGCVLALPALAHAQQLAGGGAEEVPILRVAAALLLCLALAVALAVLLRGNGLPRGWPRIGLLAARLAPDRRIAVIEARRISTHAELCLVSCGDWEYLILCGPSEVKVLSRMGPGQRPPFH